MNSTYFYPKPGVSHSYSNPGSVQNGIVFLFTEAQFSKLIFIGV